MSATYVAGQKLRAVDLVPQKLWTVNSTSDSTSIGTTETVISTIGTAPSSTYRAGRAYKIEVRIRIMAAAGALDANFRIRDTNTSGTTRMGPQYTRIPAAATLQAFMLHFETYVANTGTLDITGRVLVLTGATSTNTMVIDAESTFPCYWNCIEMGAASDFPEAVAL